MGIRPFLRHPMILMILGPADLNPDWFPLLSTLPLLGETPITPYYTRWRFFVIWNPVNTSLSFGAEPCLVPRIRCTEAISMEIHFPHGLVARRVNVWAIAISFPHPRYLVVLARLISVSGGEIEGPLSAENTPSFTLRINYWTLPGNPFADDF